MTQNLHITGVVSTSVSMRLIFLHVYEKDKEYMKEKVNEQSLLVITLND